jgi:hypothetical protein
MTASSFDASVRLDGNAAAGVLREVFAAEMTTATCRCAECGRRSAVGALHLYGGAIGSVLRCPSCEALVLTITSGPRGWFVELRGIVHVPPASAV